MKSEYKKAKDKAWSAFSKYIRLKYTDWMGNCKCVSCWEEGMRFARREKADIDLMIGGSPCQDLSIAKKNREGLKGCRSGLFYEFVMRDYTTFNQSNIKK